MLTPYEAAQYLEIEGATQASDQFGDVILAASIGCSPKHVLTLSTPQLQRFNRLYQVITLQRAAAAALLLGIVGYACSLGYDFYTTYERNSELEQTKLASQNSLDIAACRKSKNRMWISTRPATSSISIKQLQKEQAGAAGAFIAKMEAPSSNRP